MSRYWWTIKTEFGESRVELTKDQFDLIAADPEHYAQVVLNDAFRASYDALLADMTGGLT